MPLLTFISDDDLVQITQGLLTKAGEAYKKAEQNLDRNVVDPFAMLFEMSGFNLVQETWLANEKVRQAQKTLQNHVGAFHQAILGKVPGWANLGTGNIVDIVSVERKMVAEIKNKYNTVKGSDRVKVYDQMARLVMDKGQQYKGFTAYYVEIIPKSASRYNKEFITPDNTTGQPRPMNSLIRQIDGYSFYALATGVPDALAQLFNVLPDVIEGCCGYKFTSHEFAHSFFTKAFGG
jgi:Eco47II restriction endonuclease